MNQSKFDSPGSSRSAEETSLPLCLSSCSPFVFSTLANETVMDWHGKKKKGHRSEVVLTSWPDRWTPLRISWRTHPLSPGTRRQSRPSRPPPLSPGGSSPPRCSSPRSGSGTGSEGGGRDKRRRGGFQSAPVTGSSLNQRSGCLEDWFSLTLPHWAAPQTNQRLWPPMCYPPLD